MNQYLYLLSLFVFLPLIILLAYLSIRYLGRYLLPLGGQRQGVMQVISRVGIDNRNMLYLVKFSESYLLLGSAPSGVTLLKEVSADELEQFFPVLTTDSNTLKEPFQRLMHRLRER